MLTRIYFFLDGGDVSGDSYHAGCYAAISNGDTSSSSANYHRKYDGAHYVTPPDNMGDDGIYGTVRWHGWWNASSLQGLNSAGNKTLFLGWSSRNGSNEGGILESNEMVELNLELLTVKFGKFTVIQHS